MSLVLIICSSSLASNGQARLPCSSSAVHKTSYVTRQSALAFTMVPPVAIMGSLMSSRSSGAKVAGSLFRYHDAWKVSKSRYTLSGYHWPGIDKCADALQIGFKVHGACQHIFATTLPAGSGRAHGKPTNKNHLQRLFIPHKAHVVRLIRRQHCSDLLQRHQPRPQNWHHLRFVGELQCEWRDELKSSITSAHGGMPRL